jgi:hypothetical protein
MDDLLRAVASHLEFFGYTAKLEGGIVKASHPERPHFWVFPINQGAFFRSLFKIGPAALSAPSEFSAFLNRANADSIVSRFVEREGFLSVEAWFPNAYNKKAFESFFSRYLLDMSGRWANDSEAILRFFPPEEGSAKSSEL